MPDDLKTALGKVASSGGDTLFYFAYTAGFPKVGGGVRGGMAVGTSKPSKADAERTVTSPSDFLEGYCWSGKADDKGTVFVYGTGKPVPSAPLEVMQALAKSTGVAVKFRPATNLELARAGVFSGGRFTPPAAARQDQQALISPKPSVDKSDAVREEIRAARDGEDPAAGRTPTVADRYSSLERRTGGGDHPDGDWADRLETARKLLHFRPTDAQIAAATPIVDRLEKELNAYHAEGVAKINDAAAAELQRKYGELLKQWGGELNAADGLGNDDGTRAKARLAESMAAAKANDFRKAVPLIQQAVRFLGMAKGQG